MIKMKKERTSKGKQKKTFHDMIVVQFC